ncbi:MAG TPA: peptide chain release factor N(5)-glutamine methyltransferase [Steroidobacteraceae bacterium]
MGTLHNLTEPAAPAPAPGEAASLQSLLAEGVAILIAVIATPPDGPLDGRPGPAHAGARLDAEVLLAHVLQRPRSTLFAHAERPVGPEAAQRFRALVARRAEGVPVAYLTGEREFWSLPLAVGPAVLIPRPETELVVERTLALLATARAGPAATCVADLGTGCGAIALALASARPSWRITATDVSAQALQLACANARRLDLGRVEFIAGDWFDAVGARCFHAVVSNPPYVARADISLRALQHEPAAALTPGPTGLEALLHLIGRAPMHLLPGAWLVLEHGADQAREVAAALVAAGYARVRCHRDLAGRDRVTEAQWP